jgi:hypothetical protein
VCDETGKQLWHGPERAFVDTLFGYSISQLKAELEWISNTLDYLRPSPETPEAFAKENRQ